MTSPQTTPQINPTMAAIGMEVAGWPKETPPTKITASTPVSQRVNMLDFGVKV